MSVRMRWVYVSSLLVMSFLLSVSVSFAQGQTDEVAKVTDTTASPTSGSKRTPLFRNYKGITIGMSAGEVRKTLERYLKLKGDDQDFLLLAENESAQVFYDANGKVTAISVDYIAKNGNAPTPSEVLGVEVQPKPDGSVYAIERYPAVGYWVSYNRTAGDNPVVSVTMQVIR